MKYSVILCVIVACLASGLFLFRLGNEAIQDYDEGIYAQVINNTAQSGDFLTLKKDGPWFEKPPLYIWEAMVSEKIFSSPELAMRLPAALAGILTVILIMLIAYEISSSGYLAAASGLILTLTPAFIEAGRQIRFDVPVTAFIVFSIYCFIKGQQNKKWWLGIGIGIALGVMMKSVIGFFPLLFIILWSIIYKKFDWLRNLYFWLGAFLGLAILLPWHIYESIKYGNLFWNNYFLYHIVNRFEQNILGGGFSNFNYLHYLWVFDTPWIVLFIIGVWFLFKERKDEKFKPFWVFALFVLFIFLIFGIAQTKLPYYLIPAFPFIALTVAFLLYRWLEKCNDFQKQILIVAIVLIFSAGFANTIYGGFHFEKDVYLGQLFAKEEKQIGTILLSYPISEKTYTYKYLYWDTIRYYAKSRKLEVFKDDQSLDKPFFIITSRQTLDADPLSTNIANHLTPLYVGQALILLEFKP